MTRDLFLLAPLGILKFIPATGRNGRKHWSRVFFTSPPRWDGVSDEFGDARGAHGAGFNELFRHSCHP